MQQSLEATLGLYLPHYALIRLSRDAYMWTEEDGPNTARLAVFAHEYVHYLHNFSTIAGVYDFIAQLRILRLFVNTVDASGNSGGSARLDDAQRGQLKAAIAWRQHLVGSTTTPFIPKGDVHLRSIVYDSEKLRFQNQDLEVNWAEVEFSVGPQAADSFKFAVKLGSHAIMEGIAWEIERIIHQAMGESAAALDARTPPAPYKITRCIFEGIVEVAPSSEMMAQVLLLSLFSADPGFAFISIVKEIKKLLGTKSIEDAVAHVLADVRKDVASMLDAALALLPEEAKGFEKRGPAGRGIAAMVERAKALLAYRREHLFFEIDSLGQVGDERSLLDLLNTFPPCPIIQESGSGFELIFLSEKDPPADKRNELGAAQGMMQFALSHLSTTDLVATAQAKPGACKFYGVCNAPNALAQAESCRKRPWETFVEHSTDGCWYAAGVAHSIGFDGPRY